MSAPTSYLFSKAPHWLKNRNFIRSQLPKNTCSWIFEQHSLTKRLRTYYGASFGVKVLLQGWYKPYADESRALSKSARQVCLIREVLLHADQTPLILARSVIPKATIAVAERNLSHLGSRPLGEVIFAYPDLQRLSSEVAEISPSDWTSSCRCRFDLQHALWGRRTIYAIPTETMLVSEFFLPALINSSS
jgi:chorismate lyase